MVDRRRSKHGNQSYCQISSQGLCDRAIARRPLAMEARRQSIMAFYILRESSYSVDPGVMLASLLTRKPVGFGASSL